MRIVKIVIAVTFVLGVVLYGVYSWLVAKEEADLQEGARVLITTVEEFRARHGRLPSCILTQDSEGTGPYYHRVDSSTYEVYYAVGFDESYTYNSKTKRWSYTTR
jgi:hypothetical protein